MKTYSFDEFKTWFDGLSDNHKFSFGNENSKNECGCLLTQFFRSKKVKFDLVTLSEALYKKHIVASIEDYESISNIIVQFLKLDTSGGWSEEGRVEKEKVKFIFDFS